MFLSYNGATSPTPVCQQHPNSQVTFATIIRGASHKIHILRNEINYRDDVRESINTVHEAIKNGALFFVGCNAWQNCRFYSLKQLKNNKEGHFHLQLSQKHNRFRANTKQWNATTNCHLSFWDDVPPTQVGYCFTLPDIVGKYQYFSILTISYRPVVISYNNVYKIYRFIYYVTMRNI